MKKTPLTRNQHRLLDGICNRTTFEEQVQLASELWPYKFRYIQKCYSRLQNLGFIQWVPQPDTIYKPRWVVTESGIRYLTEMM
jgi:hypothetical protein